MTAEEATNQEPEAVLETELFQPEQSPAEEALEKALGEAKEFKEKYLLLLAETENVRKRMIKERQDVQRLAIRGVLLDLLVPLDQLDGALSHCNNASPEVKQWALGFKMILNTFKETLAQYNVHVYHAKGKMFDPDMHEAIEACETDAHPEGTIIEEIRPGYRIGDTSLRPAQVKVAKAPKKLPEETEHLGGNDVH